MSRSPFGGLRRCTALSLLLLLAPPAALVAATITVDTTADADIDDADCSLREAIVAANTDAAHNGCAAGNGIDRIEFALAGPQQIVLASELPVFTASAGLVGPGVADLALDGDSSFPILVVDSAAGGATLYVSDLTLTAGLAPFDPGDLRGGGATVAPGDQGIFVRVRFFRNEAVNGGGGLFLNSLPPSSPATAILDECSFEENVAQGAAGGGGLYASNGSVLTIRRSTFAANEASATSGGGGAMVINSSTGTVRRSTVSGNRAGGAGGGIMLFTTAAAPTSLTITDSTVSGNEAALTDVSQGGGGIAISPFIVSPVATSLSMQNTIVAGNVDGGVQIHPDFYLTTTTNFTFASGGFNLVGSNASPAAFLSSGSPNSDGDFVGTAGTPFDPLLAPLADNGGTTLTQLPLEDAGSLVVDHGDCFQNAGDQRGYVDATSGLRPVDNATVADHVSSDGCDIGAAELGATPSDHLFADDFESGTTFAWSATVP